MLEIVNVDIDGRALRLRDAQLWLRELTGYLGEQSGERIVFIPPLLANAVCIAPGLARLGLGRGTLLSMLSRPLRFGAVFFAYPGIGRKRLPWAVMHDRMEAFLRNELGAFAEKTGSSVITTVLADHPRTHWESWPERGDLYHSVQTIRPDGDPTAALRQRRPETSFGDTIDIDPEDSNTGSIVTVGDRQVGVVWDGDSRSAPEFQDAPAVIWCPRIRMDARWVEPASLLRYAPNVKAVITTGGCQAPYIKGEVYTRLSTGALQVLGEGETLSSGIVVTRTALDVPQGRP